MGYDAQLTGQQTSKMTYQPRKLGQTDLFLVCDQSSPWSALAVLHVSTYSGYDLGNLLQTSALFTTVLI